MWHHYNYINERMTNTYLWVGDSSTISQNVKVTSLPNPMSQGAYNLDEVGKYVTLHKTFSGNANYAYNQFELYQIRIYSYVHD